MDNKNVKIQTVRPDGALRSGDFNLLPINPQAPIITSHPLRNFSQLTWTTPARGNRVIYKSVQPINNTYVVLKGTAMSWTLYAVDPSNISNINDTSNLTFNWKRDNTSLYEFNRLNQGKGTSTISYTVDESVEYLTGTYVCEVSNEYGTTSTVPFNIRVIDLDNDDVLYKNLIANGDGGGGNSEWTNSTGNIISAFTDKSSDQSTKSTLSLHFDFPIGPIGYAYTKALPFRFGYHNSYNVFYSSYIQWKKLEPNLDNVEVEVNTDLPEQLRWLSTAQKASTIASEDINQGRSPSSFFPGPNYIDNYNNNQIASSEYGSVPLKDELDVTSRALTYFTRDLISFGQDSEVKLKQTIDISQAANLIDGQVGGVDYITAQVFAYAGSAISRMMIRCTIGGKLEEYPWLVHDSNTYRRWLTEGAYDPIRTSPIIPDPGTPIEIVPIADDSTELRLTFLDELGNVLGDEKIIKGPDAIDLWAVKEKVDFAVTLFPLFAFFKPSSNPINVFNQTYTNTDAIKSLFFYDEENRITRPFDRDNISTLANSLTDRNAKFIVDRWGKYYSEFQRTMYNDLWEGPGGSGEFQIIYPILQKMAAPDKGSSAFFGIGKTITVPSQARSAEVEVVFTNNSPSRQDDNPEGKGWTSPQIYNELYSIKPTLTGDKAPNPLYAYGEPRCGITKIKLQLTPNNNTTSKKHTTYKLPPAEDTVAGIARSRVFQNVHNTSEQGVFTYPFIQPKPILDRPSPTATPQDLIDLINESTDAQSRGYMDPNSLPSTERLSTTPQEDREFELNQSINQEAEDQATRDLGGVEPVSYRTDSEPSPDDQELRATDG